MLKRLTQTQAETFQKIVSLKNINKQYPTIEKLARFLDVSRSSIWDRIKLMEKKGYLVNDDGTYKPTIDGIEQYMKDISINRFKNARKKDN